MTTTAPATQSITQPDPDPFLDSDSLSLLHEATEARDAAALLLDLIPAERRQELPHTGTLDAWTQHRQAAWLRAQDQAQAAWLALQTCQQLLAGLTVGGAR